MDPLVTCALLTPSIPVAAAPTRARVDVATATSSAAALKLKVMYRNCKPGTSWFAVSQLLHDGLCRLPDELKTQGYRLAKLPAGRALRGRDNDNCSGVPDRPLGYDFSTACKMHDYGYELIRQKARGGAGLDPLAEPTIDRIFRSTLLYICRTSYKTAGSAGPSPTCTEATSWATPSSPTTSSRLVASM